MLDFINAFISYGFIYSLTFYLALATILYSVGLAATYQRKKVGGIIFIKVGNYNISFSRTRNS